MGFLDSTVLIVRDVAENVVADRVRPGGPDVYSPFDTAATTNTGRHCAL